MTDLMADLLSYFVPLVEYHRQVLIVLLTSLIYFYFFHKATANRNFLPGPIGIPVVGYMPFLGRKPFIALWKLSARYGNIYQIRMGSQTFVILNTLAVIKKAFNSMRFTFAGRPDFPTFKMHSKMNIFTFQGYSDWWYVQHKFAQRTLNIFLKGKQGYIEEVINDQAVRLTVELIEHSSRNGCVSKLEDAVRPYFSYIMYYLCFGTSSKSQTDYMEEDQDFLRFMGMFAELKSILDSVAAVDMMPWTSIFLSKQVSQLKTLATRILSLIDRQVKELEDCYKVHSSPCIVHCLLDPSNQRLIIKDDGTSDVSPIDRLVWCIQDFLGGASEGAVNCFCWCLMYLARYPEMQSAARQCILRVLGSNRPIAATDRALVPYVDSCLWEIMRHSHFAPFSIPHATVEDCTFDGYFIPKGSPVIANFYSAFQDNSVWLEPDRFEPERFLTEDKSRIDSSKTEQVICFGSGLRRCIGKQFGQLELFVFFVTVLRECVVKPAPGVELTMDGLLSIFYGPKPCPIVFEKYISN